MTTASSRQPFGGVSRPAVEPTRWRTVDIVVAAVIAVAFGVVFSIWNAVVWPWLAFLNYPAEYAISGVWLLPAVVAPLIVRRPGAALFAEVVAAVVSTFLPGNPWGIDVVFSGLVQGAAAELIFAFAVYRSFGPITALFAGAAAGVGEALHDTVVYNSGMDLGLRWGIAIVEVASAAVIAGLGGWLLVVALRRTGALDAFAVRAPGRL